MLLLTMFFIQYSVNGVNQMLNVWNVSVTIS